ncbi:MAG: tetratricopeptide repeat protein [Candidatus Dormibacteria bacterium]
MRLPDPAQVGQLLLVWAALMLMLPKRSWRQIPARLGAVAHGDRHHLYGPPTTGSASVLDRLAGNSLRALEMGLPLFVLALVIEGAGSRQRHRREDAWSTSAAALIAERTEGKLDERALQADLQRHGHLPLHRPEPPAQVRRYLMPPISWRIEWEQRQAAADDAPAAPLLTPVDFSADGVGRLTRIEALGPLRIWAGEKDLAPALLARRRPAFTWLYLVAREVLGRSGRTTRDTWADEVVPGLDLESQRSTLTNRLSHLRTDDVLRALMAIVVQDGIYMHLDLSDCSFDAKELIDAAEEVVTGEALLHPSLALRIETLVTSHNGEFLPEWDELALDVTKKRGTAIDLIRNVRRRLEEARAQLLAALGESCLARREPGRAVRFLEQALEHTPDSEEIAARLASACIEAGQAGYAKQVRQRYGLTDPGPEATRRSVQ